MTQPLVTRPAYGHGGSSMPTSESKLPGGGPSDRGLPLDSGIPGTQTFSKPVQDIRSPNKDDESIHRIDNPDDISKDRSRIDTVEDNANKNDGIGQMGKGVWDTTNKTKYPYRDDRPNQHYAAQEVLNLWLLRQATERTLPTRLTFKVAVKMSEILQGLDKKVRWKSGLCRVSVKRKDPKNLRWIFSVVSGGEPRLVNLKAEKTHPNQTRLSSMELKVKCSCPAWEFSGAEHFAQTGGYLDGKPRGTATAPEPSKKGNRVCKHVAAVLTEIKEWVIKTQEK